MDYKMKEVSENLVVDFSNTEIAFEHKSEKELKKAAWLFNMMQKTTLVDIGSKLGIFALNLRLPFVKTIIKNTIFEQFCGGTSLKNSQGTINKLYEYNALTILDYGAEAKSTEADYDVTTENFIEAVDFGSANASVPVISAKVTGVARFGLLEKITAKKELNQAEKEEWQRVIDRVDKVCKRAFNGNVGVFFDAEESWIQDAIDEVVDLMMERYNKEKVVVYNTYQMYRHDRLAFLKTSFEKAKAGNYILGAKLVRGAYMEKERNRAAEMKYPSPIQKNKEATDADYNAALQFCIENYERISSCNATHNEYSTYLQAELIHQLNIDKNHPHINFCQLYGMSDHLTFNLAKQKFNAAKYVPYGPVRDVIPYLIRRANENSSVSGEMSRELSLIQREVNRRKGK